MTVIHIVGPVWGGPSDLDGTYVKSFDPDARDGHGHIIGTRDRREAKHFDNAGDAFSYWRQCSTVLPTRPDGKPNRPLTAYTCEFLHDEADPMFVFGEGGTG